MSLDNKDLSLFCVYMHTNQINNKRYVGITNQKPSYRWRTDGSGYKHQMFGRAIDKYGWENFSHELLAIDASLNKSILRNTRQRIQILDIIYPLAANLVLLVYITEVFRNQFINTI